VNNSHFFVEKLGVSNFLRSFPHLNRRQTEVMKTAVEKAVGKVYSFLFPDSGENMEESTRFNLLLIFLSMLLFTTAAYTFAFLK
jgi:hypothetical protein